MVVLYSTGCPKCNVLKKKLDTKKIEYVLCTNTSEMLEKGITDVPCLEINGELMGFIEANKYINGCSQGE